MDWCKEVTCTAINAVESDIASIDVKMEELIKDRATRTVVCSRLLQRLESLQDHGPQEAAGFQAFMSAYQVKEAAVLERQRQAKVGLDAAGELKRGLSELVEAMRREMAPLKTQAHELLLDVAADCAVAYKLGHNGDYLLNYYEKEHDQALEAEKARVMGLYRNAIRASMNDKRSSMAPKFYCISESLSQSSGVKDGACTA